MNHNSQQAGDKTEQPQPFAASPIALPKGGGAIRGMGEKFAANPVTGTGSMTVPIATSPGRSGFGPQLALFYDSGAGNGPFGFGWNLSLPAITRKTDKGLPQYLDGQESDVFILSGAEDLVPVHPDGSQLEDDATVPEYVIHRYRPRIERLFARIERWTHVETGDVHWRSISKDNLLTIYGQDENSRIADPEDMGRIFSWLICETRDDKGNAVVYEYKPEDGTGIDLTQAHERNRGEHDDSRRAANRYLKRIVYGNRAPLLDDAGHRHRFLTPAQLQLDKGHYKDHWMFEVVLDYGEHDSDAPMPEEPGKAWPLRNDPFSTYRAGFEVRTCRLCRRVLMFHHFPDKAGVGQDCLVRSTTFDYQETTIAAFITAVTQSGYKRTDAGDYLRQSLPPLAFEYSQPVIGQEVHDVDAASVENLPVGVDGAAYQWVDLDGEGLSGVLTEQGGGWFYKRNQSALAEDRKTQGDAARFSPLETVARVPNGSPLARGAQFLDLAGDGQVDVVELDRPMAGFYERTDDRDWESFRPFTSLPNLAWSDPNLKFVDLTGDGHADVLITEDWALTWYPSLAEDGFGPANHINAPTDEERGPRVVFADGTQTIFLADLSGDGLTDLARIRNGEVCYWPNLGYGRFGAKVTMDDAPWFDAPDQFDPRRIRLADIDGSGTTDLIYLGRNQTRCWFNQCGNRWGIANELAGFPPVDNVASVAAVDVLGNGTACLVWSSPLPADRRAPMKYLKLMAKGKPHLLVRAWNNLGAETRVRYAPSTYFYLRDQAEGRPWITKLPFPVHVVERVETYDHISRNRFVTRYAYHHGYFDGEEREFRGFGMVEQWDTEQFAALADGQVPADNIAAASHVPPVHTKTWFHTGVYLGRDHVSDYFSGLLNATDQGEYFREPGLTDAEARALLLPDTVLPTGLTLEEEREACRALKGSMLRQEVYADDAEHSGATPEQVQRARYPYTVTEQNFSIRILQPRSANRHAVFFTHAREAISYHYERNPADPRIQHALTLEVDDYGNVRKQAAIGYGRRVSPLSTQWDRDRQTTPLLTYTENRITNAIESVDTHRTPLPCETVTFELTGYAPTGAAGRYQAPDFVELDPAAPGRLRHKFTDEVAYEAAVTANPCRRPIEWLRTLYRRDDLSALLPLGQVQPLSLPGESYKLAFSPGLLALVFQRPRTGQPAEPLLPDPASVLGGQAGNQGGYVRSQTLKADGRFPASDADGHWWIPSGRLFFSPDSGDDAARERAEAQAHFFLPRRHRDPFDQDAIVDFDAHDLLMAETRDALGNRVTVETNDYRVLQPRLVSDSNRNQTEVAFDALGMVVGTAVMGKPAPAPAEGDTLTGFVADLTPDQRDLFMAAPRQPSADPKESEPTQIVQDILQGATTRIVYDLDRFRRLGEPPFAATIARETHVSQLGDGQHSKLQISFSYSDGFGREIQKKIQAEPGPLDVNDPASPTVNPHWVGSGWTIFNNKGKPVRQYEPFFSATHGFEFGMQVGVSPILFYDPVERVVATLHPNHSYEKVVFDPWRQTTYDVNDTIRQADANGDAFDPKGDPDVGQYFERLLTNDYLPTWYGLRTDPDRDIVAEFQKQYPDSAVREQQTKAAQKAADHADTPTTAHFDALGRPFLTLARNRVVCPDHELDGTEESFATRVELDIEGNQREVIDAKDRIVMRYDYDLLGNRIHQASMEAGERWMLNDVAGQPLYAWDSRDHRFRTAYDPLRRPTDSFLREGAGAELRVGRSVYGETRPNPEAHNLRGKVVQVFDQAGGVTSDEYDFKGNLLRSQRQLAQDYKTALDWSAAVPLEADLYISRTRYDALNRPTELTAPDRSVIRPGYNEANLLERLDANLRGAQQQNGQPVWTPFVADIDYDAKGQRTLIDYGNGVRTTYRYDPLTFRLVHLLTRRNATNFPGDCPQSPPADWSGCQVQNLHYTYDPAGNITYIRDDAQQTIYFKNQRVEPSAEYTYDALYRLIEATGREHLGQAGGTPIPHSYSDAPRVGLLHPGDGNAMGTYLERYVYDAVGNFLEMQHRGGGPTHPDWTRAYAYNEPSLLEPGKPCNRLTSTTIGGTTEIYSSGGNGYDPHGNMLRMPHLQVMQWDFKDQLHMTQRQAVNTDGEDGLKHEGERTWYVYDASGQRVRKVTELANNGGIKEERIYLGGFEIYRSYNGPANARTVELERETLHIMDDKQRIALVETRTQGNDGSPAQLIRFQFSNHLGSVSLELDDTAKVISYEEYTPYGSTSYQAVDKAIKAAAKRYRYTGKERDEESGFYYHGARYAAAWLGRWISCDPAGPVDGPCLYQAVRGNPVRLLDPSGRQSVGQLIEDKALQAIKEDRYVSGYLWSFADVAWSVFGAEGVSKVAAGNASTGDYVSAGIEVASAIPVGKLAKGAKALFAAKGAAKEVAPVVAREVTQSAGEALAKEVAKDSAPAGVKEVLPAAAKETAETTAGLEGKETANEAQDRLFLAAKEALKKADESKLAPVAASTLGSVGKVSSRSGFRGAVTRAIKETIKKEGDHPLKFLLNAKGELKSGFGKSADVWAEMPEMVEAGHAVSKKALTGVAAGTDRFMVMSVWHNRMISGTVEHSSKGGAHLAMDYALEIGGIPVHAGTAYDWVAKKLLAPEVLASARKVVF